VELANHPLAVVMKVPADLGQQPGRQSPVRHRPSPSIQPGVSRDWAASAGAAVRCFGKCRPGRRQPP
jgi:hypothetical protein